MSERLRALALAALEEAQRDGIFLQTPIREIATLGPLTVTVVIHRKGELVGIHERDQLKPCARDVLRTLAACHPDRWPVPDLQRIMERRHKVWSIRSIWRAMRQLEGLVVNHHDGRGFGLTEAGLQRAADENIADSA